MFFFLFFLFLIYIIYLYINRKRNSLNKYENIKIIKNVVIPTIINEQTYFFAKATYTDTSFYQLIKSNDVVSNRIIRSGKWPECQEIYDIYKTGKRDGVFIDFGANIGSCSFVFAQAGVKVYAFEPLPNNLFQFSLTTFRNPNFTKYITIYPYALGNKEQKQIMKIIKKNWSFSSLYYNHSDYTDIIYVKKLDEFDFLIPKKVSMIKIDVEGAEYDLIEGGKLFFENHKSEFIHMECSCGNKDIYGKYEIEKIYNILNKMGYEIIRKFDCSKVLKSNIVAKHKQ